MTKNRDDMIRDFQNQYPRFKPMLFEAQNIILDQEVSDFPVFVFSRNLPELGVQLYESRDPVLDWYVHASSLEELVTKNVVDNAKVEEFKKVYKDPKSFFCVLLLDGSSANFVFPAILGTPFSDN